MSDDLHMDPGLVDGKDTNPANAPDAHWWRCPKCGKISPDIMLDTDGRHIGCDMLAESPVFVGKKEARQIGTPIDPAHYHKGGLEAIDVMEAFFPDNICLSQVFKYMSRAGRKTGADKTEDLKKAEWYLKRAIDNSKKEKPDAK